MLEKEGITCNLTLIFGTVQVSSSLPPSPPVSLSVPVCLSVCLSVSALGSSSPNFLCPTLQILTRNLKCGVNATAHSLHLTRYTLTAALYTQHLTRYILLSSYSLLATP